MRSPLTPSGITATKRTPRTAHAIAKAIDVEPLDASTTVLSSWISPVSIACERMNAATRSFVEPLGKRNSSFSQMVHPVAGSSIGTVGVPAASRERCERIDSVAIASC